MEDVVRRELRMDAREIDALMQRLDAELTRGGASDKRRNERYATKGRSVTVEFLTPGERVAHHVPVRNLSRTGLAFLLGQFVYNGTPCRVRLVSEFNREFALGAKIVRCRYLKGTRSVHEVAAHFDEPIVLEMFERRAARVAVLVAENEPMQRSILTTFLKKNGADTTIVADSQAALDAVSAQSFDLLLVNAQLPAPSGLAVPRALRERGVFLPVVALSETHDADIRRSCIAAGCVDFLVKPVTPEAVARLIDRMRAQPLYSTLVNDVGMRELIDEFVGSVLKAVRELEQAYAAQDLAQLALVSRTLRTNAGSLGFDVIATACAGLEQSLAGGVDASAVADRLNALALLCCRVRRVE
ncbi:MAG: response regulator [Phycisphaerae bacterium]